MKADVKRKTLVCLVGIAILTVLIATAVPHLELKPGLPLPALVNGVAEPPSGQELQTTTISISTLWKAILSICVLVVLIYNAYRLLRSAAWNWRDIVDPIVYICIPVLITVVILVALTGTRFSSGSEPEALPTPIVEASGPALGPLPISLIWIAGLSLAALLVGAGLWFIFRQGGGARADPLVLQAEWALQALKKGSDLKNVIVRCYWQMGELLKEEQGIEMKTAMTVREFEDLLEARGVPHLPVHQLTRLFETVRYGHRPTSIEDERQAVDALTAIVQYSQGMRP